MQRILTKVYKSSSLIIVPLIFLLCLVCNWPVLTIALAMLASIVISSPATVSLHLMIWLSQKMKLARSFAWMILFASIPLISLIDAWLFADYVPGKVWFLLLIGMASGYAGILSHGISVAQFFNPTQYESEERHTID